MLQDCVILIGKQQLFIVSILIDIFLFIVLVLGPQEVLKKCLMFYKKTPIKWLIYFLLWIFLTSFLSDNLTDILTINFRVILIYGLVVIPTIVFLILAIPKYFSYKKLLFLFVRAYQFIMYYGILDFLFRVIFHMKPPLYSILCSRNYFAHLLGNNVTPTGNILQRSSSIFFEPSFFATFIFLFAPFVYILATSKVQLTKSANFDKLFKIHLVLLLWICLIFTFSPIYIILTGIYTVIFFKDKIIKALSKLRILLTLSFIILFGIVGIWIVSHNKSYEFAVHRVKETMSVDNLEVLVVKEPSLAIRIISTANTFQAALTVPIKGCGYGNYRNIMTKQYNITKLPIPPEINERMIMVNKCGPSPNIFWATLLQTGFIGIFLLYTFFIQSICYANKTQNYFVKYEKILLQSTVLIAVNYIIISFYWSLDYYPLMWFIFGLLNSFIYTYKNRVNKVKTYNNSMEIKNYV